MTRDDIIAEARRYKEPMTPWRHRGRTPTGLDCAGLITIVCDAFGHPYVDDQGYGRHPDGSRFVEHFIEQFDLAPPGPLKKGMIVVLRDGPLPCHCGILGERHGRLTLIHSSVSRRGVAEEAWDQHWQRAFRCALEFKGIED